MRDELWIILLALAGLAAFAGYIKLLHRRDRRIPTPRKVKQDEMARGYL